MGMADDRRREVEAWLSGELQPGERIVATLSFAQVSGPIDGSLGLVGSLLSDYAALTVTTGRVLLVSMSGFAKPKGVTARRQRREVRAREHRLGLLSFGWKGLAVSGLGGAEVVFRVPMPHRDELARVLAALGGRPA